MTDLTDLYNDIQKINEIDESIEDNLYSELNNSVLLEDTNDNLIESTAKMYDLFNEMTKENNENKKEKTKKFVDMSLKTLRAIADGFSEGILNTEKNPEHYGYMKNNVYYITKGYFRNFGAVVKIYDYIFDNFDNAVKYANENDINKMTDLCLNAPYLNIDQFIHETKLEKINKGTYKKIIKDSIDMMEDYEDLLDKKIYRFYDELTYTPVFNKYISLITDSINDLNAFIKKGESDLDTGDDEDN